MLFKKKKKQLQHPNGSTVLNLPRVWVSPAPAPPIHWLSIGMKLFIMYNNCEIEINLDGIELSEL